MEPPGLEHHAVETMFALSSSSRSALSTLRCDMIHKSLGAVEGFAIRFFIKQPGLGSGGCFLSLQGVFLFFPLPFTPPATLHMFKPDLLISRGIIITDAEHIPISTFHPFFRRSLCKLRRKHAQQATCPLRDSSRGLNDPLAL